MTDENKCTCTCESSEDKLSARLGELLAKYRRRPGALMPVLQQAQGIYGYLPEHVLRRISDELREPISKVLGVVTFYSFFSQKPRGKNLIRVCMGTACYVLNAQGVLDAIKDQLSIDVGETTKDKLFTLETGRCFGACGLAPVVTINEDVFQRVDPASIGDILDEYRGANVADQQEAGA